MSKFVLHIQGIRRVSTSNPLALAAADAAVQSLTSRQRNSGHFTDQATMRLRSVCARGKCVCSIASRSLQILFIPSTFHYLIAFVLGVRNVDTLWMATWKLACMPEVANTKTSFNAETTNKIKQPEVCAETLHQSLLGCIEKSWWRIRLPGYGRSKVLIRQIHAMGKLF